MRTKLNRAGREVQVRWKDETFECAVTCPVSREAQGMRAACRRSANSVRFAHSLRFAQVRSAFTLIELLVVMGIISILAALILPALHVINERTKVKIARTEMASIQAAILGYETAYGRLPMPSTAISGDFTFGPSGIGSALGTYSANNSELMAILMDMDQLSNAKHALNPRKLSFFTANRARSTNDAGLGPDLVLRDPWGNPYIITINYSYNNRCQDALYSNAAVAADPSSPNTGYKGLFRTPPSTTYELAGVGHDLVDGPGRKASVTVPAINGVNADNVLNWSK